MKLCNVDSNPQFTHACQRPYIHPQDKDRQQISTRQTDKGTETRANLNTVPYVRPAEVDRNAASVCLRVQSAIQASKYLRQQLGPEKSPEKGGERERERTHTHTNTHTHTYTEKDFFGTVKKIERESTKNLQKLGFNEAYAVSVVVRAAVIDIVIDLVDGSVVVIVIDFEVVSVVVDVAVVDTAVSGAYKK